MLKKIAPPLLLLLLLMMTSPLFGKTFRFLRFPGLSPDGKRVVFSYQGDLWMASSKGGRALRLTVHKGYDWNPRFSPDGKWIAFNSLRSGNVDIYLMTSRGEKIKRVTHYSESNLLQGWTSDGKGLIFSSRREVTHLGPILYSLSLQGGTPLPFLKVRSSSFALSHSGEKGAFVLGNEKNWRKGYRGSGNNDLYLYEKKTGKIEQLTTFDGRDDYPLWSGKEEILYFISNRDGTDNLWIYCFKDKTFSQLTAFKGDGVRHCSISLDGKKICLEVELDLQIYDTEKKSLKMLKIWGPDDQRDDPISKKLYSSGARSWDLSPDGKTLAFVVRGEVFVMDARKGGMAKNLTHSSYREKDLVWRKDGKRLYFASNRTGEYQIYTLICLDKKGYLKGHKLQLRFLRKFDKPVTAPLPSPDGKKLAFVYDRGDLAVMDLKDKKMKILHRGFGRPQFCWSPDSRWIAFSREDNEFNSDVWILSVEENQKTSLSLPFNLSRHPDGDHSPIWSPDGRFIAFVSRRNNKDNDIWIAYLKKEDFEKSKEEWGEYFSPGEKKAPKAAPRPQKKTITIFTCSMHPQIQLPKFGKCPLCAMDLIPQKKEILVLPKREKKRVEIDFQGLEKRLRQLSSYRGEEALFAFSPDSKTLLFSSNTDKLSDLYSVQVDGSRLTRLTENNCNPRSAIFGSSSKVYFQNSSGKFYAFSLQTRKMSPLSFLAQVEVHLQTERKYLFREAWNLLNQNFYDPHFHGTDWKAQYKKYSKWISHAGCQQDFLAIVRLMLGELNASHLNISEKYPRQKDVTGVLGIRFQVEPGGVRVTSIIPGTPASYIKSRLQVGDLIRKVEEKAVTPSANFYLLFQNRADQETLLTIDRQGKEMEILIRPTSPQGLRNALYREWVEGNRAFVERESKGTLGYIHIKGMNWPSLENFERDLYAAAHNKKGLVIDVRYNGGGWTADYLMTILSVKRHAFTVPRGGGKGYPQGRLPYYVWTKPAVTLCNQYSFSNAEIFSHAFKTLHRGKLIGKATYGGVISTGGAYLMDGSKLRLPFRGWYHCVTGKNMENGGAVPDIEVENPPGSEIAGRDFQLKKAVEALMEKK